MHEIGFDHTHVSPEEREHLSEVVWSADNVEFTTVGLDVGSSTSHLMFARVHLQRLAEALSSRFVVVDREILWRSPILLTPYDSDDLIDAQRLGAFVRESYRAAGLTRGDIDSGAVVLTGEALKRRNARAIAELFAAESGKFVCASAGHHLEAAMAAHGSGAAALSRNRRNVILNVDIGGGTTKFALIQEGEVRHTAAVAVGGRLVVHDADARLTRVEAPARTAARAAGVDLARGRRLGAVDRERLAQAMAAVLISFIRGEPAEGLAREVLVTDEPPAGPKPDAVTFSGGVSEYLFGRESGDFGDIGRDLADALAKALSEGRVEPKVYDPGHGIRATVIGASQFSVQVSGNTIAVSDPSMLPIRNLPVLFPALDLSGAISADRVAREIGRALARFDLVDGGGPVALAFRWRGDPLHARLHSLASGIRGALPKTVSGAKPLVLLIDGDVGMTLGRLLSDELGASGEVTSIDGVQLKEFDYVDIGEMIRPTNVVPVVIKSLLFSAG